MIKERFLTPRLLMIEGLISSGRKVADIGCDHGYLSIALAESGREKSIIAADLREGPLRAAAANIERFCCADKVALRLSDGFGSIEKGETDAAVISGMGGMLIIEILEGGADLMDEGYELVLSPQSDIPAVREWLTGHGFSITDEAAAYDEGKYYIAIKAVLTGAGDAEKKDEAFFQFGEVLMRKKDPVFREYLLKERASCAAAAQQIEGKGTGGNGRNDERLSFLIRRLGHIDKILGDWYGDE